MRNRHFSTIFKFGILIRFFGLDHQTAILCVSVDFDFVLTETSQVELEFEFFDAIFFDDWVFEAVDFGVHWVFHINEWSVGWGQSG